VLLFLAFDIVSSESMPCVCSCTMKSCLTCWTWPKIPLRRWAYLQKSKFFSRATRAYMVAAGIRSPQPDLNPSIADMRLVNNTKLHHISHHFHYWLFVKFCCQQRGYLSCLGWTPKL